MVSPLIRPAIAADAAQILEIYAPFCDETAVSFELRSPTLTEMQQRLDRISQTYPWIVCEYDKLILGYAYASQHRERAAYQWAVDVAIYNREGYRRVGVGRALYASLFEILRSLGYYKAYAGVTLPNPSSVGLHEAMGFELVGIYKGVGYKTGAWRDVGWWQHSLQPETPDPNPPVSISGLPEDKWQQAIATGERLLRL